MYFCTWFILQFFRQKKLKSRTRCTVLFWLLIFWAWCAVKILFDTSTSILTAFFPKSILEQTLLLTIDTPPYGYDILKKQRAWKNISHQKANQNRFRALSDLFFSPLLHNAILSQKCGLSVVTQKWMANWHHFYNFKTKKKVCPSDMSDILGQTHVSYVWHC